MRTRALTDAALLAATFVALMFVSLYFPLGFVLSAVLATPHAIIAYRHGISTALLAVVVSLVLLFLLADVFVAISNTALFALPGVVMGYTAKRSRPAITITSMGLTVVIAVLVIVLAFQAITGTNVIDEVKLMLSEFLKSAQGMYSNLGVDTAALEQLEDMVNTILLRIIPAGLIMFGFGLAYVNYWFFYLFSSRLQIKVAPIAGLTQWQFPRWMGVAFIAGFSLMVLPLEDYSWLHTLGLNLYAVFSWVVLAQGLSLAALLLRKYQVPRFVLVIMVLLVIFNPLLIQIMTLVGLFDMFFSYKDWILGRG